MFVTILSFVKIFVDEATEHFSGTGLGHVETQRQAGLIGSGIQVINARGSSISAIFL
jgi:hypothetical protein